MTNAVNLASAAGTGFAFRNRIINGDMRIAQRGTSLSVATNGNNYTLDRWFVYCTGAAVSVAQVSGPTGFRNALQITGAASNTNVQLVQRIESLNCSDLVGQPATVQITASASSAQTVSWAVYAANSADTWSSSTLVASGTFSVTTSPQMFSVVIPASSMVSAASNGLQLVLQPNNGSGFTTGTLSITGVQLEVGSVATPFERRPYGLELALCQRYFTKVEFADGLTGFYNEGSTNGTSAFFVIKHQFPVTMRAAPTFGGNATYQQVACSLVASFTTPLGHVTQAQMSNTANLRAYAHISSGVMQWSAEL